MLIYMGISCIFPMQHPMWKLLMSHGFMGLECMVAIKQIYTCLHEIIFATPYIFYHPPFYKVAKKYVFYKIWNIWLREKSWRMYDNGIFLKLKVANEGLFCDALSCFNLYFLSFVDVLTYILLEYKETIYSMSQKKMSKNSCNSHKKWTDNCFQHSFYYWTGFDSSSDVDGDAVRLHVHHLMKWNDDGDTRRLHRRRFQDEPKFLPIIINKETSVIEASYMN